MQPFALIVTVNQYNVTVVYIVVVVITVVIVIPFFQGRKEYSWNKLLA